MLGWRCRTKIIHVRQQGKWEWPQSTQCSDVSRHFLFSQGARGCRNRGLREAKHKNTPSLQCPKASAASVYPLLALFAAHTSIRTGKERATGRPRHWKSMSPWINSLLILDNSARELPGPCTDGGRCPCERRNSLERLILVAEAIELKGEWLLRYSTKLESSKIRWTHAFGCVFVCY